MINNIKTNIDKILFTIGLIFFFFALFFIANTPTASEYEVSIYTVFPVYFWILVIGGIILGEIILIKNAFFSKSRDYRWGFYGLVLIILFNLVIILLPMFRNYYVTDVFDEIAHLGMIKDIILTGHIGPSNFYPLPHILTTQIIDITELNYLFVYKLIFPLFFIIYMLGLFLLAREINNNLKIVFLIMAFAAPPLFTSFGYLFLPTQMSLYWVPLLLFFLLKHLKNENVGYSFLFVISIFLLPYMHPLGSLFTFGIFLLLGISSLIVNFKIKKKADIVSNENISWRILFPSALILFIPFFVWFSSFGDFGFYVNQIAGWINNSAGASEIQKIIERQQEVRFTPYQLTRMVMLNYGQDLIFSILAFFATLIMIKSLLFKDNVPKIEYIFFIMMFSVFSLFYAATLIGNFMTTGRDIRIFCWALVASIFVNGVFYYLHIEMLKKPLKILSTVMLTLIIGISTIFGVFNLYSSPLIRQENLQATKANLYGMEWYLINKSTANTISIGYLKYSAPGYLLYGYDSPKPRVGELKTAPNYFGYDKYNSIGGAVEQNTYVVVSKMDRYLIKYVPDFGEYSYDNFSQLANDPAVKSVYFNGDTEIMEVTPSLD